MATREEEEYTAQRWKVQQRQAVQALEIAAMRCQQVGVKVAFSGVPIEKVKSGQIELDRIAIRLTKKEAEND